VTCQFEIKKVVLIVLIVAQNPIVLAYAPVVETPDSTDARKTCSICSEGVHLENFSEAALDGFF